DRHLCRSHLRHDRRRTRGLNKYHRYLHLCLGLQIARQGLCLCTRRPSACIAHRLCAHRHPNAAHAAQGPVTMAGQSLLKRILGDVGLYGAVALYVAFALLPIFWTVKISVTPQNLLYSEGIRFWPSRTTLANYHEVLSASDFPRYFLNSVIVSLSTAIIVTAIASFAGYALSRFRFNGKTGVSFLLLMTQTFPLVMVIPPIYRIMG